jgi:predicted nucleic acid-binding protein
VNGLGLDVASAVQNVEVFSRRVQLLSEDAEVAARLYDLVRHGSCSGKQIHDANIAATMLAHGVPTLVTGNPGNFERFSGQIVVRDLAAV